MVPDLCWWGFIKFTVIQKQYAHFRNHISSFAFWSFAGLVICRVMIFHEQGSGSVPSAPSQQNDHSQYAHNWSVYIQSFHLSCTVQ